MFYLINKRQTKLRVGTGRQKTEKVDEVLETREKRTLVTGNYHDCV